MKQLHKQDFARQLRRAPTSAEQKLWGYLRKRSLEGFRFNRQATIGPFIVDFLCREKRLIVEVDGATHADAHELRYDEKRTAYLMGCRYVVFRVSNAEVYHNINGVLEGIAAALQERQSVFALKRPLSPSGTAPPAELGSVSDAD